MPRGDQLEEITRTGVDGNAYFNQGARSTTSTLQTHETFVSGTTSVKTKLEAYRALQGTVVTVVDGHGTTWTNVLVSSVECVVSSVGALSGGTANADKLIQATWSVVKLGAT